MTEEKKDLTGENVHGVKDVQWFTPQMGNAEYEDVVEPTPVEPEPEPEQSTEEEEMTWGTFHAIAKHHRKCMNNAITLAQAKEQLEGDKDLLESYKNIKKW